MPDITKLANGFRIFKATTFPKQKEIISHFLEQGQKPTTLIISCSDIKLAPAEIFATNPGELYVINNIGGMVPKYGTTGIHGILSAIEYAVINLEVQNIVVLGHSKCDGIKMMLSDKFTATTNGLSESMKTWLSVASEAREAVKKQMADKSEDEQQASCEHESVIISLRNLMTYPYILKRLNQNKLNIFGWHFNTENREMTGFNPDTKFSDPFF